MLGVVGGRDLDEAVGGRHQRGSCPGPGAGFPGARQNRLPERFQLLQLGHIDRLGLILALIIQPVLQLHVVSAWSRMAAHCTVAARQIRLPQLLQLGRIARLIALIMQPILYRCWLCQ